MFISRNDDIGMADEVDKCMVVLNENTVGDVEDGNDRLVIDANEVDGVGDIKLTDK